MLIDELKQEQETIVLAVSKATAQIMEKTGLPLDQALLKAKQGFKDYVRLRVEAMRDLVDEGYSEEHAFQKAKELVNYAVHM